MFSEIVEEAKKKLKGAFPNITCYDEFQPQGFLRPSFTVLFSQGEKEQVLGGRAKFTCTLKICYYDIPFKDGLEIKGHSRLNKMAMALYRLLDLDMAVFAKMSHKIELDELIFTVKYVVYGVEGNDDLFFDTETTGDLMEDLTLNLQ